mmetsp:Transcript_4250/g.5872  ORF Transcript_4250/g.5872 Transcript_4250/m.5872 type:complete len:82 (-) Transcript_4250:306-551(-)
MLTVAYIGDEKLDENATNWHLRALHTLSGEADSTIDRKWRKKVSDSLSFETFYVGTLGTEKYKQALAAPNPASLRPIREYE